MTFNNEDGYVDAFYKIAAELGFDLPQAKAPKEVFEEQIFPEIRRLKEVERLFKTYP